MTLQDELAPEAMALADHHCHGLVRDELDAADVDALLSEGGAAPPGTSNFDTPVGLAVRRHCAPLLDLPAHAPAVDYLPGGPSWAPRTSPAGCCGPAAPGRSWWTPASGRPS
jgi:hypothetical protein